MKMPQLGDKLPDLMTFVQHLTDDYQQGILTGWDAFRQQTLAFYTPVMMDKVEAVVPGWTHMASYADRQTLVHVTSVLVALLILPEYQDASAEQQTLMEWMALFHDVAKRAEHGKHDYIHAFRSAAITGAALAAVGFPAQPAFAARIAAWQTLTESAIVFAPAHGEYIQDNTKLPQILSGIDSLYGHQSAARLIIEGVLFHLSISTDPGYPTVAPLTPAETRRYIDRDLFPILKVMMLVDGDAWNLFAPAEHQRQHQLTLDTFEDITRANSSV